MSALGELLSFVQCHLDQDQDYLNGGLVPIGLIANATANWHNSSAERDAARKVIEDIRDLARTGLAPVAFGFTEEQWSNHRLNRIAGNAAAWLEQYPKE